MRNQVKGFIGQFRIGLLFNFKATEISLPQLTKPRQSLIFSSEDGRHKGGVKVEMDGK
jgi:hypothetical protein